MMSLVVTAALLAAASGAGQTSGPTTVEPAVATAPSKTKPRPDEMVCKREPVLGSRMKQRTCLTQADWDTRKADARAETEKIQTAIPVK